MARLLEASGQPDGPGLGGFSHIEGEEAVLPSTKSPRILRAVALIRPNKLEK
jgi:hypothetical protein